VVAILSQISQSKQIFYQEQMYLFIESHQY
jgi:hypothetical protein